MKTGDKSLNKTLNSKRNRQKKSLEFTEKSLEITWKIKKKNSCTYFFQVVYPSLKTSLVKDNSSYTGSDKTITKILKLIKYNLPAIGGPSVSGMDFMPNSIPTATAIRSIPTISPVMTATWQT